MILSLLLVLLIIGLLYFFVKYMGLPQPFEFAVLGIGLLLIILIIVRFFGAGDSRLWGW